MTIVMVTSEQKLNIIIELKICWLSFYTSLTKPTFKYRPAVSTPMSDEYNAMITESVSDMEYIIKDCEALNNLVSQSFTVCRIKQTNDGK